MNAACHATIARGHADGTQANHRTHEKSYMKFCAEYLYEPFPADKWWYVQFGQYLSWQDKCPDTVDNYVSTVRVKHRLKDLPVPEKGQIHYKLFSDGLKKADTRIVQQAGNMTQAILFKLAQVVNFAAELEAVAFTAILIAFSLVLRVSNIGPPSRAKFDPHSHLKRSDVRIIDGHVSVGIRWSKTVQHRNKVKWTPLMPSKYSLICPVRWLLKMFKIIKAYPHEPLFMVREGKNNDRYPLTSSQVRRLMKKWCEMAGLDPKEFTPHCLRRGGLNWAHKAKLSGEALQLMGGWRSDAYMDYIKSEFEDRVEAGKAMQLVE